MKKRLLAIMLILFGIALACKKTENAEPVYGCLEGNCENGIGKFATQSGVYTGQFKGGIPLGDGIFIFANGDRYEGYTENYKKEKYGTYYYRTGERYVGEWKNDAREGQGIYYYSNGDKYVGQWIGDVKKGNGVYYYRNGDRFEGTFEADKPHGAGALHRHDGTVKKGFWVYGQYAGNK
jgi:hypothetical protein